MKTEKLYINNDYIEVSENDTTESLQMKIDKLQEEQLKRIRDWKPSIIKN